jgi:rhodanese-related sulfurtransferase
MSALFKRTIWQAIAIVALSVSVSLTVNGLSPEGLALVYAQQSAVQMQKTGDEISIQDAALLYAAGRTLFLDARSRMEYEDGHIKNAVSLPVEDFDVAFRGMKDQLQGRELLVTYCDGENCPLSKDLADALIKKGFTNVQVLKDGWTLWNNEKLPIEVSAGTGNR